MTESIQETRFDNGLVVLTDRMQEVRSATIGFFYRVGARDEPSDLNGISHFIEHCVFKGTRKRSALDIAIEQDRLGGNLDAFTTHEETGFVIKVIDDRLDDAFDLLSDMLTAPRFDETDLKNEQRVIIEEIKMNDDAPEELLSDIFQREFFAGSSLGLNIAGTPESVKTFDAAITREYHTQVFSPGNLVIAAAGNVEHSKVVDVVKGAFLPVAEEIRDPRSEVRIPQTAAPISVTNRPDLEQAHFVFAVPTVSAKDPRRYAADLLASVLGGGTSSRLWQKIREDRGLTYSIGASAVMFRDTGFMSISGSASPEHMDEITEIVIAELKDVIGNGISEDELQLQKDQTRAGILLALEDSASRAAALAQSEMTHGRQIRVDETIANMDAVTVDDLVNVAEEFFKTEKMAFTVLGDLEDFSIDRDRLTI